MIIINIVFIIIIIITIILIMWASFRFFTIIMNMIIF